MLPVRYVFSERCLGSSQQRDLNGFGNLSSVHVGIYLLLIARSLTCMLHILLNFRHMSCTWGRIVNSCQILGLRASRIHPYTVGNDQVDCMSNTSHYIVSKLHSTSKIHSYTVNINSNQHLNIVNSYLMSCKVGMSHSLKHNQQDILCMFY